MRLWLPLICVLLGTAAGVYDDLRRKKKAEIFAAFYDFAEEMLYLLQSGCYGTSEILERCAASKAGETLPCIKQTLTAVGEGEDLHLVWEEKCGAFCKANGIANADAAVLMRTVKLLGSMEHGYLCTALAGLKDKLQTLCTKAKEDRRIRGAASVKIGLLVGVGLGLLLWQP